ncbi:hypothetical protein LCGC14_2436280, partial [marine sediment metagenome]
VLLNSFFKSLNNNNNLFFSFSLKNSSSKDLSTKIDAIPAEVTLQDTYFYELRSRGSNTCD